MIEIENFLSLNLNEHYESFLLNKDFPWFFSNDITNSPTHFTSFPLDYAQTGFHHTCFVNYQPASATFPYFSHLVKLVEEELPKNNCENFWHLYRLRCGFNIPLNPKNKKYTNIDHNTPHIDHDNSIITGKTFTCLYYINETDGDTVIFNELASQYPNWPTRFNIKKRVSPSKNKLLIFDGDHFHASSSPKTYDTRLVLTFNFHDKRYEVPQIFG